MTLQELGTRVAGPATQEPNRVLLSEGGSRPITSKTLLLITRYVVSASFWALMVIFLAEVCLRFCVEMRPFTYRYDPIWGWRPASGSHIVWAREGWGHNYYIADGELSTPYETGPNLVILGDSHTEALQVDSQESFVSVAERILVARGLRVNLRNLGKSDASLADYIWLAPEILERYQPKLVVIQLSETDFRDEEAFAATRMNYFTVTPAGALQVVHTPPIFQNHWLGRIMQSSSLIVEGIKRYRLLRDSQMGENIGSSPSRESGRETVAAQLAALSAAYKEVPVIITLLPYVPAVQNTTVVEESAEYESLLMLVKDTAGWRVIDPLPAFMDLAAQGHLPRGFTNTQLGVGHLNANGHAVVGSLLADQIEALLR